MTDYRAIVKQSRLYPVLVLEGLISHERRHQFIRTFMVLILLLAPALFWPPIFFPLSGLLLVLLALLCVLQMLEAYFRSYYFGSIISNNYKQFDRFTFTVGRILLQVKHGDLLRGFADSTTGRRVLRRAGITEGAMDAYLTARRQVVSPVLPKVRTASAVLRFRALAELLLDDQSFAQFLLQAEIRSEDWLAIAGWVVRQIETEARRERWWSQDNLDRLSTLASDWSYGGTYTLDRYSRDLLLAPEAAVGAGDPSLRLPEVEQLETILARSREQNALLVGAEGEGKMEVLWQFARELKQGSRSQRLLLFNTALFFSGIKDKPTLEQALLKIFNEAAAAGNVILIIDNLAALVLGAERLGSDVIALLDPYLASAVLPLVALTDTASFHHELESRAALLARFEKVALRPLPPERLVLGLTAVVEKLEHEAGVWFTYQAVRELVRSAKQYFSGEETADQVTDLAIELVPWAMARRRAVIGKSEVLSFVGEKTNIPLDLATSEERDKLLRLEAALQKRIIGQTSALGAISRALRRNRAGVRNPDRPIGSFLFLGPTGVGKTETAKALAAIFFGREGQFLRLDMSEFQSGDALDRLIGSFATGQTGILADLLREHPYGVLLLDEFEKTDRQVLNLFLQILDEGFFSDRRGERVNARNILFIATSNAGAEMIWQMVKDGRDPSAESAKIVDRLVTSGVFRPELLNRFDEVIVFHPLGEKELKQVAVLQLGRLVARLREQGIAFNISDALITDVVTKGANQLFGARPMQRYIQDNIEEKIAQKIISGELVSGATITM